MGSQLSPENKNCKGRRPQYPPSQRNPPQWPTVCTTGLLFTDNFQKQWVLPRGLWLVSPCPTFTTHFWAHNAALHWRRGGPLIFDTGWVTALCWRSSQLPGPSTVLAEVHLWRPHCPASALPLCSTNPQPSLHTAEKSSHFVSPFQPTKTPCMRTYLPAWRRVAQTSPMGEQCSEHGVAIYVFILKTKLEKWPREQWQNFSSLSGVLTQRDGILNSWLIISVWETEQDQKLGIKKPHHRIRVCSSSWELFKLEKTLIEASGWD